ncbi:hypothetical protein J2X36_000415 [Methylobacterium sp. BE186]|nr:hypothetical protein [Methylobacterium sp. BE186]
MRLSLTLAVVLGLSVAGPALAQGTLEGPRGSGGRAAGTRSDPRQDSPPAPAPNGVGNPSGASVPGSTPGVNIGGTPTSGPPGTGGTAGGPGIGNR